MEESGGEGGASHAMVMEVLRSASEEECEKKNAEKKARGERLTATCKADGSPLMAEKLASLIALHDPLFREKVLEHDDVMPLNRGSVAVVTALGRIAEGGDFIPGYALGLSNKETKAGILSRCGEWTCRESMCMEG